MLLWTSCHEWFILFQIFQQNISNSPSFNSHKIIKLMQTTELDPHASYICSGCKKYSNHPVLTECGHLFCWACLYIQTKETPHCPLCKRIIDIEKTYPVFTQHEQDQEMVQSEQIPSRPNPSYQEKILNPSMANGGMPLGISNLSHNLIKKKLVAGVTFLPSIFINAFNSPDSPRPIDPDYQIYKKFSIISLIIIASILIIVAFLIIF